MLRRCRRLIHYALPADRARQEAPANLSIEQWRPGLPFGEVKERAAREGMHLRWSHTEGNAAVYRIENSGAGSTLLGFCGDRLLFVRHVLGLASTLQAIQYVSRIAGRRPEAVVGVEFDPDRSGANSGPRGELTLAWRTDDDATMEVELKNFGSGWILLVETLSAPDRACLP